MFSTKKIIDNSLSSFGRLLSSISLPAYFSASLSPLQQLSSIYNPRRRKRVAPGFNWYYLHVTALNTAWIIQEIHAKGYVLGDIKLENILVNDRTMTAVIDTDSFQVRDPQSNKVYRCTVGSEGFTPPELLGKDFDTTNQTEIHDRFRLGVLIHYLLFGYHPFSGNWTGVGESPEQTELIKQGYWYGGHNSPIRPSKTTIPLNVVHPELEQLFLKCFNDGHTQPHLRPSAQDWHNALEMAVNQLTVCGTVDSHHYSRHYGKCYWCERAANLGVDIFPGSAGTAKISTGTSTVSSLKSSSQSPKQPTSSYSNNSPSSAVPSVQPPKSPSQSKPSSSKKLSTKQSSIQSSNSGLLSKQNIANIKASLYKRRKFLKIAGISSLVFATGTVTYNAYNWVYPILVSLPNKKKSRYKTINEAIKNAEPNSTIQIPPGIYREGLIIDKPMEIIGDGLREKIIIESADSDCILMQTDSAVVRGLTLKCKAGENGKDFFGINIPQGKLIVEDCDITSDSRTCIVIYNSEANPIIHKCRIHDGKKSGVFVYEKGQGTIEDCDIYGNAYAEVAIQTGGNPIIRKCRIYDGEESGIHIYEQGQGTIEDCDIYGNAYGGVAIQTGGNPIIRKCRIYDGEQGGVFVYDKGQGTIEDCDIYGNTYSGVAIKTSGDPVIRKCRIYDGKQFGIYVHDKGQGTIEDCGIYGNAYSGAAITEGGNPTIRKCRINRNVWYAVYVHENGRGTIEECDLRNNTKGSFYIDSSSWVQRSNNLL